MSRPPICQIISATTLEGGLPAERMATVFPWMLALNAETVSFVPVN